MKDLRHGEKYFHRGSTRFWHLCSLGSVPLRPRLCSGLALGSAIDSWCCVFGVQLMAWQVTFELIKPTSG